MRHTKVAVRACALVFALVPLALPVATAAAPPSPSQAADGESVVRIVPDPHSRAGALRRLLHGRQYRDFWTQLVTVPVLDLHVFAGGLIPTGDYPDSLGQILTFSGSDGRTYAFRRLAGRPQRTTRSGFDPGLARGPASLEGSVHPAASVVASAIREAAGLLHAHPIIVVLPDDPALGRFRAAFAGRLGFLEEFVAPTAATRRGALGSSEIVNTRDLLDSLRASPVNRVESRAFLAARLVDFMLGDFDDDAAAWNWARSGDGPESIWRSISSDANRRLSAPGGLMRATRRPDPSSQRSGRAREELDRELLSDLDGATWDSVATALQARLSDATLVAAVNAMPPEMRSLSAAPLLKTLRARRGELTGFSRSYYQRLSEAVDLRTAEVPELAVVHRLDDRHMEVEFSQIGANGEALTAPHFRRRFDQRETREVRLHLFGAGDRVVVRGTGQSAVVLRIVGDGSGATLVDSSRVGRIRLYDSTNGIQTAAQNRVLVDRKPYHALAEMWRRTDGSSSLNPDYGGSSELSPWRGMGRSGGFFVGGQYSTVEFGFRQPRYASRTSIRAGLSPGRGGYQIDASREQRRANSGLSGALLLRASNSDLSRFFGMSNETPDTIPRSGDLYRVRQTAYEIAPSLTLETSRHITLTAGLPFKLVRSDERASGDSVRSMHLHGWGSRKQLGGRLGVTYGDEARADQPPAVPPGVAQGALVGSYYPGGRGLTGGFGALDGRVALALGRGGGAVPALTIRAGGKKTWGPHPFYEAAFLGGAFELAQRS